MGTWRRGDGARVSQPGPVAPHHQTERRSRCARIAVFSSDERHLGNYKTLPDNVEAFDADGRSVGIIFETATPFDTPRLMESLVAWTNEALTKCAHHPLLVVAIFVVRLLAVLRPVQDGNGRLSRALTTLMLLRAGTGTAATRHGARYLLGSA